MKMRNESVENVIEAPGVAGAHACMSPKQSLESGPADRTNDIDDRKTPPVFGRLWRELVSVFTLAFSPGLNVRFLFSADLMR